MRAITLLLTVSILPVAVWAQHNVIVDSARPLVAAIRILEQRYDWQIIYEDPPWSDPTELVDRTHPNYKGTHRAIDPRGGRLDIQYAVSSTTGKPDPVTVLQLLLADHGRRGNPGRFQIKQIGGMYGVIPAEGSILDVAISLPEVERNYMDTLSAILRAVSQATGIKVSGPGWYTSNVQRFKIGAKNELAREVLLRFLGQDKTTRYGWHLLYAPMWGYAFNTITTPIPEPPKPRKNIVMKEVTLPDGTKAVVPVEVP